MSVCRRVSAVGTTLLMVAAFLVGLPAAAATAAALTGEAVTLPGAFRLVRSNGAEVTWSPYAGTTAFDRFEVHRSATANFTPSASTLLTTIRNKEATSWQDTTAKPGTFFYRVVTNGSSSNEVAATLPAAGQAVLTLQPDAANGKTSYVAVDTTSPVGCYDWNNYGKSNLRIGTATNGVVHRPLLAFDLRDVPVGAAVTSANLTLGYGATTATGVQVNLHRVTRAWKEGTGGSSGACNGSGANWNESQAGVRWTSGGDIDGTADASLAAKARTAAGTDQFNVLNLVREWTSGAAPNHGMLLKLANEALPTTESYFDYYSDDYSVATSRPKLVVQFADGSAPRAPRVSVAAPLAGSTVRGSAVRLSAAAGDDGRVAQVDFFVDGAPAGTSTAPPYAVTWNATSVANGSRAVTAKATDDVGQVTTSAPVSVVVDNTGAPTVSMTSPASGTSVAGTVTVSATAADDNGVSKVEFYADDDLIGTATTSPYRVSWNTLDLLDTAFDGTHTLTAKAYDAGGQATTAAPRTVTVVNTVGTRFQATFDLNATGTTDDAVAMPPMVLGNEYARPVDVGTAASASTSAAQAGVVAASTGASLGDAPDDGTTYYPPPPAGSTTPVSATGAFKADVTVTNTSPVAWKGGDLRLWYRWYTSDGVVLFEGQGSDFFPQTFQTGKTKLIPVTIEPPPLPLGADLSQVRLRFDLFDTAGTGAQRWFSANGNKPPDNPVLVTKTLNGALGLERFWQYDTEDTGTGMGTLTNVANGNMLLRWSPLFAPGRGLSTAVDLTYNSLEDHSDSPAGNNFSLSISGLSRIGTPIDIHPNKADEISGKSNKYVVLTDGDGTTHTFTDGHTDADGITRFTEPPGVNLYLRSVPTNTADRRWAATRPDNVTFYYDTDGFPTAVVDRNGNTLKFNLQTTPPGEDPGGPKKRVTSITDPGGRNFTIDYYSRAEAKKAHIRGKIQTILDHTGSALDFQYYEDGNLLSLVQRGGLKANGDALPDRSIVFTYTTSNGAGPAITDPAARANPDPHTPNQSTRIYSVRDANQHESTFAYYLASDGAQLRWKLKSRTDREGNVTSYAYDTTNRVTTVSAPMSRITKFTYDTTGKVTSIVNPLNQTVGVQWSADFKVTRVTEPTGKFSAYTYNANGYPLDQTNQATEKTVLTYVNSGVDPGDAGQHLSLLSTVTTPKGVATATAGDFQWKYSYDTAGNVDKVTDPSGAITNYDFNLAGSAAPGTVSAIFDANGNPPLTFPAYDPSGQPTQQKDALGNLTRFGYDPDGLLRWVQDPNHANDSGTDERAYKIFFDYDAFHRLGRQSAPKSTANDRGRLIWSGADMDPNDNALRSIQAHYGSTQDDPENGAVSTASYDKMDRPTLVTGPDTSADPAGERTRNTYDAAGRLAKQEQPRGVQSATADDFATVYVYDGLDRVARETRYGTSTSDARITHLCFDLAGDLRSVTSPRAGLATLTCPGNGPATGAFTAAYTYDAAHRLASSTDPGGHQERRTYDANGNVSTVEKDIDTAAGRKTLTTTTYDQRDKPVKKVERFDGTTRDVTTLVEYDPNGNRSKVVSPRGFDTRPTGPYDSSAPYVTFYSYDANNRPTRTELPHDSRDGTERQYQHRAYDANGGLAWSSLPVTSASPADVKDTAKTVMAYFDPGWVRTSKEQNQPKVTFDYTAEGWQAARTPDLKSSPGVPDTDKRMTWQYFADGKMRTRMDQGGQPSTYAYDADNNLTKATDAAGVVDPGEAAVSTEATYTGFDEVGKVRHRKQGAAAWTFSSYGYDPNGNVTQRKENGEEATDGTQTKAPRTHNLTYDAADWLSLQLDLGTDGNCKDDQRIVTDFWASGWEKQRDIYRAGTGCSSDDSTWPKKQTTSWTHFDNGKLRTLTTKNGSGTVTESHDVGYVDNGVYLNGNRVTDHYVLARADGNAATTCVASAPCDAKYAYDARDRVTSHQPRANRTDSYTFDEPAKLIGDTTIRAGNVTNEVKNGTTTSKRYTATQLTEISTGGATGKYWYDDLGNTDCLTLAAGSQADCSPSEGGTASGNLVTDYRYDYLNRLEGFRQYSAGSRTDRTQYTYDALDRTTKEQEDHGGSGNDRTTTFTYQALTRLATEEKQAGGTSPKTKSFSYDAYGHRVAMTDTDQAGTTNTYTYGQDVHSSVSQLIDDAGKVKASYGYDAYGGSDAPASDPQALTTGDTDKLAPINPYRYASRRMDSGTVSSSTTPSPVPNGSGGYDMGARRYGPDTGSFIQQDMFYDAIGDLGLALDPLTQNRYSLAGGNPISYVETDGHMLAADGGGGGSTSPNPTGVVDTIKDVANDIKDFAEDTLKNITDDWVKKPVTSAAGALNDAVVGSLAKVHYDILKKQSEFYLDQSKRFVEHYLKTPGGTAHSRWLNEQSFKSFLESDKVARQASTFGRRFLGKVPIVGTAITAASIGLDIHQGKPAGKAIISGVGGALAAAGTGAAIGTAIGGPVGTIVGGAAGLVVGTVTSGALDAAYDRLPQGVQQGIENGVSAVGEGVKDVGSGIAEGAKDVFDSVF